MAEHMCPAHFATADGLGHWPQTFDLALAKQRARPAPRTSRCCDCQCSHASAAARPKRPTEKSSCRLLYWHNALLHANLRRAPPNRRSFNALSPLGSGCLPEPASSDEPYDLCSMGGQGGPAAAKTHPLAFAHRLGWVTATRPCGPQATNLHWLTSRCSRPQGGDLKRQSCAR